MPQSKALEVNLRTSRVEVSLDPKYQTLLEVVAEYLGLAEGLTALLEEVCHPYKNWRYVLDETRRFALNNYHLFLGHERGPEGVRLLVEIFFEALSELKDEDQRIDAVDTLLFYLQQIINESETELPRFIGVLADAFDRLRGLDDEIFFLVVSSYHPVNLLALDLCRTAPPRTDFGPVSALLHKTMAASCRYWLGEPDPQTWFESEAGHKVRSKRLRGLFTPVSHHRCQEMLETLNGLDPAGTGGSRKSLSKMAGLPSFKDLANHYEQLPRALAEAGERYGLGEQWMLIFSFHIMNVSGLAAIHERTLREVNRSLAWLIGHQEPAEVQVLIAKTFRILNQSARRYPRTALNCVLNAGQAVYRTDESDLVEFFSNEVVDLGFQAPELGGVGDDWQVKSNEAHVLNIRVWLQLIELNPRWSKKLLSALIINLALGGVFIKDNDLFSRDITGLLDSDISPVYNLVKQLCRLFPSYFNEIGAEGQLRDISTQIDEISRRDDPLVHFLRKHAHVESSPRTVTLIEQVIEFWRTKDKKPLRELVPPDIWRQIVSEGTHVDGMHRLVNLLFESGAVSRVQDLLQLPDDELAAIITPRRRGVNKRDRDRLSLAQTLYQMLYQKYHADDVGLENYLDVFPPETMPRSVALKSVLALRDPRKKLVAALEYLEVLKGVILSEKRFEPREDIYHKRHIAADIPSMYGSYHEVKFDALGLTFRLEALVNTLFQELIDQIDLKLVTRATFVQILDYLRLFDRALKLDDIGSQELERQIELLTFALNVRGFSYTQYLDIFRGFSQAVSNIVNDHFNNIHQNQLGRILAHVRPDQLMPPYLPVRGRVDAEELNYRVTEIFLRERISTSLGLQAFDQLMTRILNTIFHQDHEIPQGMLPVLLNYEPDRAVTPIAPVNETISDVIHLGAKGYNLTQIIALGLPVPPGFIVTTQVFRCREVIERYEPAKEQFRGLIASQLDLLEKQTGRKFGDPKNPLLLSVRSGSSISQPGMLATFLNVGINEKIVEGLAEAAGGRTWFAWDCYRRFLQSYGMSHGLSRNDFDAIILEYKQNFDLSFKREFSGEQMGQVALAYKDYIRSHGIQIEERPFEQLILAIQGVFASWDSTKARTYRQIMDISDDWGTAVTVQAMIFGNLSYESGSGVFFTHNPRWSGDKLMLWGDFTLANQGEDVVSGLVGTLPITRFQAEMENRPTAGTLEEDFPEIYRYMRELAKEMIYTWGFSPQEMEFTFEGPSRSDLYFLQTRDMVLREHRQVDGFDPDQKTPGEMLGRGIGVSGGRMTGRIVFSLFEIQRWRSDEPETPLILVRGDTVPDDIREINEADGLLTARGGSTSHAAIVAHRLKKTCIVGCEGLVCDEPARTCTVGRTVLKAGDWITIDGLGGSVYKGRLS
ncbi:MAG: pyruvate, phosphate dikinase [Proteobacteria bacterium]|nr:pyruvate, phosphate dikinase [Pseudomonadota bacterium]